MRVRGNRGSLNLEISLVIALLVLAGITGITALSSGISVKYIRGAETASLGTSVAPMAPVADWLAQSDGTFRDTVSGASATVARAGNKTIFTGGRIMDVYPNRLAVAPWSDYKTGGTGYAAVIEEARTNYLLNSYFENGLTNWNNFGGFSNTTLSTVAGGVYGGHAARVQIGASSPSGTSGVFYQTLTGVFFAGDTITFSTYLKGSTVNCMVNLNIIPLQDSTWLAGTSTEWTTLGTEWTRYSVTCTLPAGTNKVYFSFWVRDYVTGDTLDFQVSAAQAEKGAFATSYIPTTTSEVTRNADIVTVPTAGWNPAAGTVVGVVGPSLYTGNAPWAAPLLHWGDPGTGTVRAVFFFLNWMKAQTFSAGAEDTNNATVSLTVPWVAAGTWSSNSISYVNGAPSAGVSIPTPLADLNTVAKLGCDYWNRQYAGPIQRMTVYNRALSGAEVTSLNGLVNGP